MTLSRIPRSDCLDSFRLPFPIKEVLKNAVAVPDWPRRRSLADLNEAAGAAADRQPGNS